MKKALLFITVFTIILGNCFSQTTGSFEETITFNGNQHTIALFVPTSYDDTESYTLLVALHGCGGNAISFRNNLIDLSDSLNAIILAPDFMTNQMSGTNGQIIPNSIDSLINTLSYNIDAEKVFMTGFSCNGQETFKQGWSNIYPFAGIIPFNSWIPSITSEYNLDSKIPTCICSGDQDPSYNRNTYLFDSLNIHNGIGKFNTMPGIGHQWGFNGQDIEMMKCFNWMDSIYNYKDSVINYNDSIANITPILVIEENSPFSIFPNPAENVIFVKNNLSSEIKITIFDIMGSAIFTKEYQKNAISINSSTFSNGSYFMEISNKDNVLSIEKFIISK